MVLYKEYIMNRNFPKNMSSGVGKNRKSMIDTHAPVRRNWKRFRKTQYKILGGKK